MTTDRPDFAALALQRCPIHLWLEDADGAHGRALTVLPLWREDTDAKGVPYSRDTWRCLSLGEAQPRAILVNPDDARLTGEMGVDLAPLHLDKMEVARGTDVMFAEFIALCARFGLRCRWSYRKAGTTIYEERQGVPAGTKADLLFALDADRGDALRSFKVDGIAALMLLPGQRLPTWTTSGYQLAERRGPGSVL